MYKFEDILLSAASNRGLAVYVKQDPQEGPSVRIINNVTRKQIAFAYLETKPVHILTKCVESQHTMNCLLMQELDYSQPWCSLNLCHQDTPQTERNALEDSIIDVVKLHHEMAVNGYRLWESQHIQQQGALKLRNTYVRQDTAAKILEEGKWEGEVGAVVLEAHLTVVDFRDVMDTKKIPNVFWDITLDHEQGRIGHAARIDPVDKFKPDVTLSTGTSSIEGLQPVDVKIHHSLVTAFDIDYTTGVQLTSQPGRVNTVKVYRCVDSNLRPFQLLLKYNL